jgi:hypothetical protein
MWHTSARVGRAIQRGPKHVNASLIDAKFEPWVYQYVAGKISEKFLGKSAGMGRREDRIN